MPHKIGFTVVSSSGHEDGFSARELMVHAPTVNGWRSPRLCQYPQEITLQLVERCRIRKLQLLAHQYMIASKIEFYISESLPEYFAPYQSERFQRLGYVPLSDNEKTDFRARELKSVYMDAVGQYLKLIFHKNYVNKYNLYGQVALVAVNIIGDPADYGIDSMSSPSREMLIDHYLGIKLDDPALDGTYIGKRDSISPLDDLAFDMYQDPEVAQIIRRLDEKKREAVHLECYDHAKKLKQAIADLQKVGERLGRYEVEKRYAVEKEDYDLAKKKKEQMDEYRLKVYQQLELHDLLDAQLLMQKPPELPLGSVSGTESPQSCPPEPSDPPQGEPLRAEPVLEEQLVDPISSEPVAPYQSPLSPRTQPTTSKEVLSKKNVEILPYDERPLPTTCKQVDAAVACVEPEVTEEDVGDTPRTGNAGEPQPTQKALREASPVVEVFGETLVLEAYSRTWSCREDALLTVYKKLMEVSVDTPKEDLRDMLRAAVFLARRAIKDTVSSVFQASLKLLKMIVTQYIPKHKLGKLETSHCVEATLPHLLSRTGDSSSRLRLLASTLIQEMALCPEVKSLQIIPVHLLKALKPNSPTHLAMSRVELVESLLGAMGTENSGFTVNNVMKFATGALEHRAHEVREVVLRIIFAMYREHRAAVLEYFPLDDAGARRTVRYKTLFEGFAKIDGKSSEGQVRAQRKAAAEAEKQTQDVMQILKGYPAALKLELQAEVEAEEEKESYFQKTENQGYQVYEATAAEIQEELSSVANYLDNLCIFCGERNETFTEEGLDLHYWKHCPMLTRCEHCKQMLEICSLTEHLLTDCDKRGSFGRCPRCREAVPRDELPKHIKSRICNPAKPEHVANHCPLCHENFPPGEEAWRSHLMNRDGCKMNQRRTSLLNKTILVQPAKVVGHYLRRPGPSGAKFQSPSIGGKIRTRGGSNKNAGKTYSKR
ncbi:centrosomal protein of 104 kDa [Passer montanus]|uniref:centrosomal protein of 104 kDa n=1 Tax=Passer montanus TaxID=9160 RepID=UPI00195F5E87|nr:centrosomal protein of 104 kDa [Passer montanus]XP_039583533.1 centrosomal protein of 104 kDa [Passer montanus]